MTLCRMDDVRLAILTLENVFRGKSGASTKRPFLDQWFWRLYHQSPIGKMAERSKNHP